MEEIDGLHKFLHWVMHNIELFASIVIASILGITWALHQVFSTKAHTAQCRDDVLLRVDHKINEVKAANSSEHADIKADLRETRTDVRTILEHMIRHD